ncbi:5700_t:CDS:2 [Cetraspora pellucida]|uniref:5700_t:CDS:1 n=1 Tax=Cetraspora pellucida TaxID=1433469 RepID=A0A9N9FFQ6_9GLOM|nr:5700_t:CDS:2 [Cetraspora pellucida]
MIGQYNAKSAIVATRSVTVAATAAAESAIQTVAVRTPTESTSINRI